MAVHVDGSLEGIDWEQAKADLAADRFDNGRSAAALRLSFEQSQHVAFARDGDRVVGMARLLSDGVCNAYLVDVWTASPYRRQGIASTMIRRCSTKCPASTSASRPTMRRSSTRRSASSRSPSSGRWSSARGSTTTRTEGDVSLTQYYTATTLDGFIADPNDSLEWLFTRDQDHDGPLNYAAFIADVGALAMGSDDVRVDPRPRVRRQGPERVEVAVRPPVLGVHAPAS